MKIGHLPYKHVPYTTLCQMYWPYFNMSRGCRLLDDLSGSHGGLTACLINSLEISHFHYPKAIIVKHSCNGSFKPLSSTSTFFKSCQRHSVADRPSHNTPISEVTIPSGKFTYGYQSIETGSVNVYPAIVWVVNQPNDGTAVPGDRRRKTRNFLASQARWPGEL